MRSSWAAAVVVLGLGLGAGYWLAPEGSAPRGGVALLPKLEALERRLKSLERERSADVHLLRAALAHAPTNEPTPKAAAADQALTAEEVDEESTDGSEDEPPSPRGRSNSSPEVARARAEAMLSRYDEDSGELPADPAWSTPALRAAQTTLAATVPGVRILEARCGGNTCRLLVEHAAGDNAPIYSHGLLELPPFDQGSTAAFTAAEGRQPARSRIYLHRPRKLALSHE